MYRANWFVYKLLSYISYKIKLKYSESCVPRLLLFSGQQHWYFPQVNSVCFRLVEPIDIVVVLVWLSFRLFRVYVMILVWLFVLPSLWWTFARTIFLALCARHVFDVTHRECVPLGLETVLWYFILWGTLMMCKRCCCHSIKRMHGGRENPPVILWIISGRLAELIKTRRI